MAVNLDANQVATLQSHLQNAQYADAYRYLRDVIQPQIAATGDFAQGKNLQALTAWFDAAAHINANDGSFVSELVRGATESVCASQGGAVMDAQFQDASNRLADKLLTQIIDTGIIPSVQDVVNIRIKGVSFALTFQNHATSPTH